ncbi:hypothetical protein LJR168_003744 [Pseudoxanthomonas sp. LjRoot168]|uniref:hypothetical protein n=1 Tax=unclassified Pseudoxanthomonas TaxID=2645906 RepID=UPI003ECE24ED
MSNPTPLTTLPDGSPNNTGLSIDSETVQINVDLRDFGRGRKSDIYIIYTDDEVDPVRQVPTKWDPASSEPLADATGTVWKNLEEQHGFDLSGETYDRLQHAGEWGRYLLHHAKGEVEAAEALAKEHKPEPSEFTPDPDAED